MDELQPIQCVKALSGSHSFFFTYSSNPTFRLADDRSAAHKALQTVVAGQQAENLLDFDDDPSTNGQPSGLAATEVFTSTPAAAGILAGTSSNPLDDLVSIFGGMGNDSGAGFAGLSMSANPPQQAQQPSPAAFSGLGSPIGGGSSGGASQKPEEDLLGLF